MSRFLSPILAAGLLALPLRAVPETAPPLRLAMMGLVHDHANHFLSDLAARPDVQLVGIVEPDRAWAEHYRQLFHLDPAIFFTSFDELMAKTRPEAVATFTSTFDHLRVVKLCAERGIDVMVEKPLAANLEQAKEVAAVAAKAKISVTVNYVTTWYTGNARAYQLVKGDHAVGNLRRIVAHDGNAGPVGIGCSAAFSQWLTDPVLNGGGALMDFGCYGVDQILWLMDGKKPSSVTAVTVTARPDLYPRVEDDATIILSYPHFQGVVQASWNWHFARKDLEIYGDQGYVQVPEPDQLKVRSGAGLEQSLTAPAPAAGQVADSLTYLTAVVRHRIQPSGPGALALNLAVMEVLDAAHRSAASGQRVALSAGSDYDYGVPEVTDLGFRDHAGLTAAEMTDYLRSQHAAHSFSAQVLLLCPSGPDAAGLPALLAEARKVSSEIVWLSQPPGANSAAADAFNRAAAPILRREEVFVIDLNEFYRIQPPAAFSAPGQLLPAGLSKRVAFLQDALEQWWTACAKTNPRLRFEPLWPSGQLPPRYEDHGDDRVNGRARLDHISIPELVRYPTPPHPSGVALIEFPGGGYSYIGFPGTVPELSERLAAEGITVIGLKYRPGRGADVALLDGLRAVRLVRYHAKEWGIDPNKIGITGQSAGAHLVWSVATLFTAGDPSAADPVERVSSRPDFAAPLTTWGSGLKTKFDFTVNLPPFFIRQAKDDLGFPFVETLVAQLAAVHANRDVHYVAKGGHGAYRLSPATTTGNRWTEEFVPWLRSISILQ